MADRTFNDVKINLTLKPQTTRENLSSTKEDLAVQMGKIQKWYTDFAWSAWTAPTVEVTGSGNAITSASYGTGDNANKLTLTLGGTFLTQHPTIPVTTDTTSTDSPAFGSTFTAVDSVSRDANGHVTTLNTKTVTIPNTTMGAATSSAAGTIGLVPAPAVGEQTSFLRGDGTWAIPTSSPYTAGTGLVLSGVTFNHSNSVTAVTTASLLKFKYDAQGHITGSTAVAKADIPGLSDYLPLAGGTIANSAFAPLTIQRSNTTTGAGIQFVNSNGTLGYIGMSGNADTGLKRWVSNTSDLYTVCDTGNMNEIIPSTKYAFVVDNTSDFASYAWHKFAEVTVTDSNSDASITFLVSKTWGNVDRSSGILTAHVRTGSTKVYENGQFGWLVINNQIDPTEFVMVYTNTASTSCKVELWHKQTYQYDGWIFKVLKEHSRLGYGYGANPWTLFKHNGHGSATYTAGTGTIVSTVNAIANTSASANKINTDAGNSNTPVYFSNGVPVAVNTTASGANFNIVPQVRNGDGVMEIGRYIDFHSTAAGTTDYDIRFDASSTSLLTMTCKAGTPQFRISGTLPRLRFTQTTSGSAYDNENCGISAYPANTSGINLVIQSAGNMFIGGGESVTAMYTAVKTSGANPYTNLKRSVDSGGTASSITPSIGNEKMFITSDEQIFFAVGANGLSTSAYTDWTHLKTVLLDSDGFFRPSVNNKGQIGTSDYKWKAVHSTEVVGNAVGKNGFIAYPEDGTFSGNDPSVPISCITITMPIDTSVITSADDILKVGFKVDMWSYSGVTLYTSDTLTIAGAIGKYDSTIAWFSATALSNCYPFTVSFGFLNSKAQIQILVPQNAAQLYSPEIRIRDIVVCDDSGNHNTFAENKSGWIIESNDDYPEGYEETGYLLNSSLTSQPGYMLWDNMIYSKAIIDQSGTLYAGKHVGFFNTSNAAKPNYILGYTTTNTVSAYAYNGSYTIFNIRFKDYARLSFQTTASGKAHTAPGIVMYPLATSGMTALFSCGGNMVIGGGEFATNAYARKNSSNTSQVGYDNIVTTESEKLYLGADTEVQIISNAGSIATYNNNNHKVWKFQTDGTLLTPGAITDTLSAQHVMIQQNLRSDSNAVTLAEWIVNGATSTTYKPGITFHNTGGDSTNKGAIILRPYHHDNAPWGTDVGLYIGKGILKLDGTNVSLEGHTHNYVPNTNAGVNAAINLLSTGNSVPVDNDYYISQYVNGGTSTTTYHRRPVSALYSYIYGKLQHDNAMNTSHTFAAWNSVGWHRVLSLPCSSSASGKIIRTLELTAARTFNNAQPEIFSVRLIGLYNTTEGFEILYSKSNNASTQLMTKVRMTKSSDGKTLYVDIYYNSTSSNTLTVFCALIDPANNTDGFSSSTITWGNGAVVDNSLTVIASLDIPRDITAPGTGFYYVIGTQTASTAAWTGTIPASKLHNGLTIAYYLPYASAASTNVTLNLTLSTGATTGAINVYYTGTTRMTTHYGAGSTIILTYFEAGAIKVSGTATTDARWTHSDYNTNTNTAVTQSISTTTDFRALMLGYNNSTTPSDLTATVTQQVYASANLYAQPSTGLIGCTGRRLITPFAIQTGSSKRQKITLQNLMNWLITTKKYIHSGIYEHVVLQTTWSYSDNDILRLAVNGINYEMDLAGVRIEYIGVATSYNAGAFTLKIISNPAPNFTATSGYTKFPPSTIAFYTCNGSSYAPVWRMIMNGACGQPKIFESTDNLSVLPMPIEVTGLFTNWKVLLAQCTRLIYGGGDECSSFQAIIPLEYLKSLGTSGEMHIPLPFTVENNPNGRNYMKLKYVNDNKFTIGYYNSGIDTIGGRGLWTIYGLY